MNICIACILKLTIILAQVPNHYCSIASQKCDEYAKAVYVKEDSPVLTMNSEKNVVSECGIVSVPLIVGGVRAGQKEFPHMAVIGFGGSPNDPLHWDCGGTLISELYVLTAVHCLSSREFGPAQRVKLGALDLDDDSDPEVVEKYVVARIPYPEYSRSTKEHDIALIKLDNPVEFTPYIRPACLNTEQIAPGVKAIATGFGKLEYDASVGSKHLMKVTLNIYESKQCSQFLKPSVKDSSIICAGVLEGGKDTCQGDSGGPLQTVLSNPYCMYNIIGVTSFGKFCGFPDSPAVYTQVANYVSWIEKIVWQ